MERHLKNGTRRINNPFPAQPLGLGFVKGDLFFNAAVLPSQSHTAGQGFDVRWSVEDGGSLQVYHASQPKRVLWETVTGRSFISAALGRNSFEESRGSLAIHDQVEIVCSHQTVEQIDLAWPSETLTHPAMAYGNNSQSRSHLRLPAHLAGFEKMKFSEREFTTLADADGVAVANKGPCVIISGCLYGDSTSARHELSAFCSNHMSQTGSTTKPSGPFYVGPAADCRRSRKGSYSKDSSVGVRYWLVFYEAREHQLGFCISLDQPARVESRPLPVGNQRNVVPVADTFAPDMGRYSDRRRHWLWSEAPVSAFSPFPSAAPSDSSNVAATSLKRQSISVGDFRTISLAESCLSNTRSGFVRPSEFLSRLHDEEQRSQLPRFNRLQITYSTTKDENFFGFGEQFSHFNLKGRRVPILVQEQGIGRGDQPITALANLVSNRSGGDWHTTYAPVPYYITSKMRSLFLEGYDYAVFDLRQLDAVQVQVHAGFMRGRILHGRSPAEIIQRYTAATGRMRELPAWILKGAIVGMQGGIGAVRKVWQQLRDLEVPLAAFWLQDWVGQRRTSIGWQLWWNWEVDRDHYPGWEELVREFRSYGVRTMAYCNPLLAPIHEKSNRKRDLLEEANSQGFVIEDKVGSPYMIPNTSFDAAMVDLTNPAARTWLKSILHEMVQTGIRGWMADFGEALPLDSSLFSGLDLTMDVLFSQMDVPRIRTANLEIAILGGIYTFSHGSFWHHQLTPTALGEAPIELKDEKLGAQPYVNFQVLRQSSQEPGLNLQASCSSFRSEHPSVVHNKYPELWARLNREFVEEWEMQQREDKRMRTAEGLTPTEDEFQDAEDEKLVFFTRAGYRGSPRWSTLFWEGDQMVSWQRNDGIKSAVTGLLTGGLCGFSLNHSDIGGYCTVDLPLLRYRRSEELLCRWMELNAFSTIFRTHEVGAYSYSTFEFKKL